MVNSEPKISTQTGAVLRAFMDDPLADRYGLDLMKATGLASGTLYPILARLEKAGWVQRHWEDDVICEAEGRPRRRYYRLTPDGLISTRQTLAEIHLTEQRGAPSKPFGFTKPQEA